MHHKAFFNVWRQSDLIHAMVIAKSADVRIQVSKPLAMGEMLQTVSNGVLCDGPQEGLLGSFPCFGNRRKERKRGLPDVEGDVVEQRQEA
jgi:hypothetical protein